MACNSRNRNAYAGRVKCAIFISFSGKCYVMQRLTHSLLSNSSWISRNILWTKDLLYFSRTSDSTAVDMIPLHEIQSVQAMSAFHGDNQSESKKFDFTRPIIRGSFRKLSSEKTDSNANLSHYESLIQIQTITNGFNFGRTYYIYVTAEHDRKKMVDDLLSISKLAATRKLAVSRFLSSQVAVRNIYDSSPCQIFVGLLILTVSKPIVIPA